MSRFNTATPTAPVPAGTGRAGQKTYNLSGGEAYQQDAKTEFASMLLTNFATDQYHRTLGDTVARMRHLIQTVDPKFAAKAAIFARDEFNMRSITHVAAGEIAMLVKGEDWTKTFFEKVVVRPDDMTETLSYIKSVQGNLKPLPSALKKGFAKRFGALSEFELGRYRGERKDISLVDVVNLVHPKATPAITKLVEGKLKFEGWETDQTKVGQSSGTVEEKAEMSAAAWGTRIPKMGYLALLRNLRNIRDKAPAHLPAALSRIGDRDNVKRTRILPFQFLTAMDQFTAGTSADRQIVTALNKAMEHALDNVPALPGEWLVVTDLSGSMTGGGWGATNVGPNTTPAKIASLFTAAFAKNVGSDAMRFGSVAAMTHYNPSDSLDTLRRTFEDNGGVGHGTSFGSIFDLAAKSGKKYDGIVIFSDMQANISHGQSGLSDYKRRTGANPAVFTFDLGGHGTSQFRPEERLYQIAGFSEKVFDLMENMSVDPNALVSRIEAVEL